MTRIHVTGSNGFIGRKLCRELAGHGFDFSHSSRSRGPGEGTFFPVEDIGPRTDWENVLPRTEVVIHLAARVHVLVDHTRDSLTEFRRVNCEGSLNLARQAARLGVRRFVYLSSIGVNGPSTRGMPFTEGHVPRPASGYAVSKWEAEQGLWEIAGETGMELVIVRPPLVYGSGVKGNFKKLMEVIARGMPLPLDSIRNARSIISVYNLLDFLILCARSPQAANQLFLVSDGEDLSTPDLVRRLAFHMGRKARIFPFPVSWLRAGAHLLGTRPMFQRLCNSLQVDSSRARELLGWIPPVPMESALERTVRDVCAPDPPFEPSPRDISGPSGN